MNVQLKNLRIVQEDYFTTNNLEFVSHNILHEAKK